MKKTFVLIILASLGFLIASGCDHQSTSQKIEAVRQEALTTIINIPNPNGSLTPVTIRRSGNTWIGPRGEVYPTLPTVEQLRPLYGVQ